MKKLKIIRENMGMSQQKLAEQAGVACSTICKLENNGIKRMKEERLKKIASIVNSTVEEICEDYQREILKIKSCNNETCPLNHDKYCQSEQVCKGAYCKNENLETKKPDKITKYKKKQITLINTKKQKNQKSRLQGQK